MQTGTAAKVEHKQPLLRPRVFIPIQSKRFDASTAQEFGQLVYLIRTENFAPFNVDSVLGILEEELKRSGFNPEVDFVALTGPQIFVAFFYALVAHRFQRVRTLLFDARIGKYVERIFDLRGGARDGR